MTSATHRQTKSSRRSGDHVQRISGGGLPWLLACIHRASRRCGVTVFPDEGLSAPDNGGFSCRRHYRVRFQGEATTRVWAICAWRGGVDGGPRQSIRRRCTAWNLRRCWALDRRVSLEQRAPASSLIAFLCSLRSAGKEATIRGVTEVSS